MRYREKHPPHRRDKELEELLLQSWQHAIDATLCARLAAEQLKPEMSQPRDG